MVGTALPREEFAEKLYISGSVIFIGLKKLVDYVEDLRRENHAFLLVRKKFNKS